MAYSIQAMVYTANCIEKAMDTHGEDNFTHLLKLMGTKVSTITILDQASQKFVYHDVQNELLKINWLNKFSQKKWR